MKIRKIFIGLICALSIPFHVENPALAQTAPARTVTSSQSSEVGMSPYYEIAIYTFFKSLVVNKDTGKLSFDSETYLLALLEKLNSDALDFAVELPAVSSSPIPTPSYTADIRGQLKAQPQSSASSSASPKKDCYEYIEFITALKKLSKSMGWWQYSSYKKLIRSERDLIRGALYQMILQQWAGRNTPLTGLEIQKANTMVDEITKLMETREGYDILRKAMKIVIEAIENNKEAVKVMICDGKEVSREMFKADEEWVKKLNELAKQVEKLFDKLPPSMKEFFDPKYLVLP